MEKINPILSYNPYVTSAQAMNVNNGSDVTQTKSTEANPFVQQVVNPASNASVNFGGQTGTTTPTTKDKENQTSGLVPGSQKGMYAGVLNGKDNILGENFYSYG